MNIKHYPITDISKVEEFYSEEDGVPVKHVCTTEFHDAIADVFYREAPHPEYGNKYFALYFGEEPNTPYSQLMIANADRVEDLAFAMVENDEGDLEYSQHRHDYKSFKNGNMIDGGRDYIRSSCEVKVFVVRNGRMKRYGANDESNN